jgi:hypothetical protein
MGKELDPVGWEGTNNGEPEEGPWKGQFKKCRFEVFTAIVKVAICR